MTSNIKFNAKNEKIKDVFFEMLEHAKGRSSNTIKQFANAIHEFEKFTNYQDFKTFEIKQAVGFKEYLSSKSNQLTGEPISKSYLQHYTKSVRALFEWLSHQKGYQKHINYNDVQYLNITRNDRNKAVATSYQESCAVEDIISIIRNMRNDNEYSTRNKAIISLCLLTTPRVSALRTARIGSIKYFEQQDAWAFVQNPNFVDTKYSRNIIAYFIGDLQDIYHNVLHWVGYLKAIGFKDKDPLFPKILPSFDKNGFPILVLERQFMRSPSSIRRIFANAFKDNNMQYYKPHSFRHSIVRKIMNSDRSAVFMSALNQNIGHAMDIGTIISSYGTLPEHQRAGILKSFYLEDKKQ